MFLFIPGLAISLILATATRFRLSLTVACSMFLFIRGLALSLILATATRFLSRTATVGSTTSLVFVAPLSLFFTSDSDLCPSSFTSAFATYSFKWEVFKQQMKDMLYHSDQKGIELKKPGASLYTFPMPDCMCKQEEARSRNCSSRKCTMF